MRVKYEYSKLIDMYEKKKQSQISFRREIKMSIMNYKIIHEKTSKKVNVNAIKITLNLSCSTA